MIRNLATWEVKNPKQALKAQSIPSRFQNRRRISNKPSIGQMEGKYFFFQSIIFHARVLDAININFFMSL